MVKSTNQLLQCIYENKGIGCYMYRIDIKIGFYVTTQVAIH